MEFGKGLRIASDTKQGARGQEGVVYQTIVLQIIQKRLLVQMLKEEVALR